MCEAQDVAWLEDFYARIMNQSDPLALCRKSTEIHINKPTSHYPQNTRANAGDEREINSLSWGMVAFVLIGLIALIVFFAK